MDYKGTINLPKTEFAMKANLSQREPKMLEQWYAQNRYQEIQEATSDRPLFIMHDGPPYANGDIHIGHAVNKILKDMVIRSRLMSGFQAPYVPGWDCHGLPIELQVEKKVGKVGHKVDAAEFRQRCRDYAATQIKRQCDDFKRLGVLGDWDNRYATSDFSYEADMLRALAKMIDNGYLHQGVKPVHWCFSCGSALAEAEIEYQDKTSSAIDVLFTAVDSQALLSGFDVEIDADTEVGIPIWTTTPWTLPANLAVALHPEVEYLVLQGRQDSRKLAVVVAAELADELGKRYQLTDISRSRTQPGAAMDRLQLQHPFYQRQSLVILGDHVTTEQGTGAVHTAPGHGQEDFAVGQAYDLGILSPVAANGVFTDDTEHFAGQHIWKANPLIVELLKENGALLYANDFEHSYPHCWRHKTPTAFRVTPQWFFNMDQAGKQGKSLRELSRDAVKQVRWVPEWGQERIDGMLENRPDWCISRQRTWGVPIPIFIDKQTGERHPDTVELIGKVADLVEQQGIDAWAVEDIATRLGLDTEQWLPVRDILDVWFDSGVSHWCVLEAREGLQRPADLYLEGSDQHRGWFQSSLLTGVAMDGKAPYRQVLTHGFTVDANGRKMSKSLGNVMAPQKVWNSLGADILRLWVAAADYRQEMTVSDEILNRVGDAYRRIRNTCRFLLGNMHDFDQSRDALPLDGLLPLDRWAIDRAWQAQQDIIAAYDDYQFHVVYQRIHQFCIVDMGGFYLDVIKDRLYTMKPDSAGRRSAQTAMLHISEAMVRWLTPVLCFTAEEIWQNLPGRQGKNQATDSALLNTWYPGLQAFESERQHWDHLLIVRAPVRRLIETLRNDKQLGNSLMASVNLYADGQLLDSLREMKDEVHFLLLVANANIQSLEQAPAGAERHTFPEGGLALTVTATSNAKCVRCYQYVESIGQYAEHPEICARCHDNVVGEGEARIWG